MVIEEKELKKARIKAKARELKDKAMIQCGKALRFVDEHREMVVGGLALSAAAVKAGSRIGARKSDKELKDKYIYDRSAGHYWKLRKKPSQNQWAEIDRRKKGGEGLYSILDDMRLL